MLMKPTTLHSNEQYNAPEMHLLILQAEGCIAGSCTLNQFDQNNLYDDFEM